MIHQHRFGEAILDGMTILVSVLALAISVASAMYARRAARATEVYADAAVSDAARDRNRYHSERAPQYSAILVPNRVHTESWYLRIRHEGPANVFVSGLNVGIRTDVPEQDQAARGFISPTDDGTSLSKSFEWNTKFGYLAQGAELELPIMLESLAELRRRGSRGVAIAITSSERGFNSTNFWDSYVFAALPPPPEPGYL